MATNKDTYIAILFYTIRSRCLIKMCFFKMYVMYKYINKYVKVWDRVLRLTKELELRDNPFIWKFILEFSSVKKGFIRFISFSSSSLILIFSWNPSIQLLKNLWKEQVHKCTTIGDKERMMPCAYLCMHVHYSSYKIEYSFIIITLSWSWSLFFVCLI